MFWRRIGGSRVARACIVVALTSISSSLGVHSSAHADGGRRDEVPDEPIQTPPEKFSGDSLDEIMGRASVQLIADPLAIRGPIEGYFEDSRASTGTARAVCVDLHNRTLDDVQDRLPLPGALVVYAYIDSIFSWPSPGTMGHCREFLNGDPGCDGRMYPDSVPIDFRSTCWSNHAAGRAVDFCVTGCAVTSKGTQQGNALVNWLLAPDAAGNRQARARRLGVQQILWNNHCWSTASYRADTDRKVRWARQMRECGIGHENHVHLDFTIDGAKGRTSAFRSMDTVIAPAGDFNTDGRYDVLAREAGSGDLYLYRGNGGGGFRLPRVRVGRGWKSFNMIEPVGDFDGDGAVDVLARDSISGDLYLYRGNGSDGFIYPRMRIGRGWRIFNVIAPVGDWNGDGHVDVITRRAETGDIYLYRGNGNGGFRYPHLRMGRAWSVFDVISPAADFDEDGHVDLMARRHSNGNLYLYRGNGRRSFMRPAALLGKGWGGFDVVAPVGDFDGDQNGDVFARHRTSGELYLYRGNGEGALLYPRIPIGNWSAYES
jgi:hypothetical protein